MVIFELSQLASRKITGCVKPADISGMFRRVCVQDRGLTKDVVQISEESKQLSKKALPAATESISKSNNHFSFDSISLGKEINRGEDAIVYHTNDEGLVVRLVQGKEFNPSELKAVENPTDYIMAANSDGTIMLMKYLKGDPLYGKHWDLYKAPTIEEYFNTLRRIQELPDKTFAEYMQDVVKIRKSGYDIDCVNPNNFLLDGTHINIVDLEKSKVKPDITYEDFWPFIDKFQLSSLSKNMSKSELNRLSDEIRTFYDRMARIAKKQGYDVKMPELDFSELQGKEVYLYHKQFDLV